MDIQHFYEFLCRKEVLLYGNVARNARNEVYRELGIQSDFTPQKLEPCEVDKNLSGMLNYEKPDEEIKRREDADRKVCVACVTHNLRIMCLRGESLAYFCVLLVKVRMEVIKWWKKRGRCVWTSYIGQEGRGRS